MIRLEKVNKYFNRHKANQIHVIDNTSLELPESGIVTLLGASGSGKTTLLNAIGGLDRINSGSIFVDGQRITRRRSSRIDTIRNANIGYIFQNFNLMDDQTVFDNVAVALRMVGIRNREIIRKRVHYCLEAVGIYAQRNKNAGALSGGQRQRVAIARAIVKNPKIIIADEPTGNLDSSNTLEIMNLIKKLSGDRLVLLVTHEENIAEFYSDRIIRIRDGRVISDEENERNSTLDYQLENRIYLKDMPVQNHMNSQGISVDVYADRPVQSAIKLAVRGGNLFIDTGGQFSVIDETSDMELIDDHYSAIDQSVFESSAFDYSACLPENFRARYRSVYTPLNCIGKGFASIRKFRTLKKLLLIGFVIAAIFAFYAVSHIVGILDVQRGDFMKTDEHYVTVANPGKSAALAKKAAATKDAAYVIPGNSTVTFTVPMNDYYQTASLSGQLQGSMVSQEFLDKDRLYAGEMPEKSHQIVVDKMVLKSFFAQKTGSAIGLTKYRQFLGRRVTLPGLKAYTVVGISDCGSPAIFVRKSQFTDILAAAPSEEAQENYDGDLGTGYLSETGTAEGGTQVRNYDLAKGSLKIKSGHKPEKNYEVIVNSSHSEEDKMKIGKTITPKMNGRKLTIAGYYTSAKEGEDTYYVTKHTVALDNIHKQKKLSVYSEDPETLVENLAAKGLTGTVNFNREKEAYVKSVRDALKTSLILAGIILLISLIEIYLMLRSSFLSRIREVGILRAIGLKKRDIYRKFAGEIIAITVITATVGIGIMYYMMYHLVSFSAYYKSLYTVSPLTAGITFLLILVFNLLAGLLPVATVMRKTPAQILARSDI